MKVIYMANTVKLFMDRTGKTPPIEGYKTMEEKSGYVVVNYA